MKCSFPKSIHFCKKAVNVVLFCKNDFEEKVLLRFCEANVYYVSICETNDYILITLRNYFCKNDFVRKSGYGNSF